MKVGIVGTGYVGLVTGTCLAEVGNTVICVDVDQNKVDRLNDGIIPIYEPGLEPLVHENVAAKRLSFTTDINKAVEQSEILFIAVGTPPGEDGSADLQYVLNVARSIGLAMNEYRVIATKSTVPVGTADKVRAEIEKALKERGVDIPFSVVSNPEFLKEGAAVEDFLKPDRIVIGVDDDKAEEYMRKLYAPFNRNHDKIMVMDIRSAELTKYAANAMLATKISFMNEMSNLATLLGADIEAVRRGIGSDPRIGYHFIYPGSGYGGSCFPKDVQALHRTAGSVGYDARILTAVEDVNNDQKKVPVKMVTRHYGEDLTGKTFAVWGLSFKPNTDDMREAPSITVINNLIERGAKVVAYDPVAMEEATHHFVNLDGLSYADDQFSALNNADGLIILTEWKVFRSPDLEAVKKALNNAVIFDGRNIFDPAEIREQGFTYYGIGRL